MLPSLADELLRSMPPELRRLFPPLDGRQGGDLGGREAGGDEGVGASKRLSELAQAARERADQRWQELQEHLAPRGEQTERGGGESAPQGARALLVRKLGRPVC